MSVSGCLQLVGIVFAISLLIGSHELGHFLVARLLNIKVLRFSLGFGKPIWRIQAKSGTEYVLARIPLGGYVKLLDEREGNVSPAELAFAFNRQALWKRFAVIIAGPLANFVLALIVYWLVFSLGITHLKPIIANTVPGSIAAEASVPKDSTLLKFNGETVHSWSDVTMALLTNIGGKQAIQLELSTQDAVVVRSLSLHHWQIQPIQPNILHSLGIIAEVPTMQQLKADTYHYVLKQKYSPWPAFITAVKQTLRYLYFNFIMTYKLATGIISLQSLSGPITIFHGIKYAVQHGAVSYLQTIAMLSIAIGFINLLPIPALDGGHLFLLLIEAVRRKPLSLAVQILIYRLGFILIMLLMVKGLSNDLLRLFG
jgi:regulator of sigma E protease